MGLYWDSMACLWVMDRGDSIQTWKVVVFILNKQSQLIRSGNLHCEFGLGGGANNTSP